MQRPEWRRWPRRETPRSTSPAWKSPPLMLAAVHRCRSRGHPSSSGRRPTLAAAGRPPRAPRCSSRPRQAAPGGTRGVGGAPWFCSVNSIAKLLQVFRFAQRRKQNGKERVRALHFFHLFFSLSPDGAPSPARFGGALSPFFLFAMGPSLHRLDVDIIDSSSSSDKDDSSSSPLFISCSFFLLFARSGARLFPPSRRRLLDSRGPRRPPGLAQLRS